MANYIEKAVELGLDLEMAIAKELEERIVNHLIDNYDEIMELAKAKEEVVLQNYEAMRKRYEELSVSEELHQFFDPNDTSTDVIDE